MNQVIGIKNKESYSIEKIAENRILFMNDLFSFIIDSESGKVIAKQRYCLQNVQSPQTSNIGNVYVKGSPNHFDLIRTKKGQNGQEEVDFVKMFHLKNLVKNLSSEKRSKRDFRFFQLATGNYLYVSSKFLDPELHGGGGQRSPKEGLVSVEIDQKTLDVAKSSTSESMEIEGPVSV